MTEVANTKLSSLKSLQSTANDNKDTITKITTVIRHGSERASWPVIVFPVGFHNNPKTLSQPSEYLGMPGRLKGTESEPAIVSLVSTNSATGKNVSDKLWL